MHATPNAKMSQSFPVQAVHARPASGEPARVFANRALAALLETWCSRHEGGHGGACYLVPGREDRIMRLTAEINSLRRERAEQNARYEDTVSILRGELRRAYGA